MSDHTIWVHNRLAQLASLANLGINNRVHFYTAPPFGCLANNGSGLQAAQPDTKNAFFSGFTEKIYLGATQTHFTPGFALDGQLDFGHGPYRPVSI